MTSSSLHTHSNITLLAHFYRTDAAEHFKGCRNASFVWQCSQWQWRCCLLVDSLVVAAGLFAAVGHPQQHHALPFDLIFSFVCHPRRFRRVAVLLETGCRRCARSLVAVVVLANPNFSVVHFDAHEIQIPSVCRLNLVAVDPARGC